MANIREVLIVAVILCSSIWAQFTPPVNTPNDCGDCVGTTCSELDCPRNCTKWQLDSRDCNTCDCADTDKPGTCPTQFGIGICIVKCYNDSDCSGDKKCCGSCPRECTAPNNTLISECPKYKCVPCPNGYKIDEDGCQTCECECPLRECGSCREGYKVDGDGCQTCECECLSSVVCASRCRHGFQKDEYGCQSCLCADKDKSGICPVQDEDVFGICTASCTQDLDCSGDKKCCGSCPRECTAPSNALRSVAYSPLFILMSMLLRNLFY